MVAHVKLIWCQVLEFPAIADEPVVGSVWEEVMWETLAVLGDPCGSTRGSLNGHPKELAAPLALLPQGFLMNLHLSSWLGGGLCWHPGAAGPLLFTVTGPLGSCHLAPRPQPVAMKLQPHMLSNIWCLHGELWSRGKCCHCSCLFLARKEKMISHACQSGSFLQHWISASLFKFLFKNPNLRQHSTWHLTLWLPWR